MPERIPFLTLAALFLAGIGAAGQFAKLSVPFDAFAAAYPEAGAALGPMITIISGLGVICGFFAGLLVARFGYRRLLLWALWGGAALSFLQAVLPPVPVMLGLRLIEGASHLVIVVAAPTLMAQLSPDVHRAKVMTVWSTFFGVGFTLGAWLGLPFVDRYGLSGLLIFHGVFMIAVAAALSLLLRGLPRLSGASEPLSLARILRAHRVAYGSPRMSPPALGWLCYTLTYVSILTVLPTQLALDDRVFASAWMPISGLLVSLTLGLILLRYLEAVTLVMLGFGLAVCVAVVLAFQPQNAWLAVGLMASLGFVQSGSFAAVPQLNTSAEDQAQANGAMAQMGNTGNLLGTPILLGIVAWAGTAALYWALAFAFVVGLLIHLIQAQRRMG